VGGEMVLMVDGGGGEKEGRLGDRGEKVMKMVGGEVGRKEVGEVGGGKGGVEGKVVGMVRGGFGFEGGDEMLVEVMGNVGRGEGYWDWKGVYWGGKGMVD
uniref:hypothetical protein n=1 Tax=Neisseria sicca TaxID=490 RepID=UPI001C9984B3